MIYTLDYLKTEAEMISGYWNGSDEKFIDGNGEKRTEDDVIAAQELMAHLAEIDKLIKELSI